MGIFSLQEPKTVTVGDTTYSNVKEVNSGHHGTVFKGFDPNGDVVAIKETRVEQFYPRQPYYRYMKSALQTEIQTLRHVNKNSGHENVMRYIDGKVLSRRWGRDFTFTKSTLVTEFCENGDIRGYMDDLKKGKKGIPRMDENRVRSYLNQAANGLKFIQNKGINYSGIKPANFLLTNNYKTLKICDFGFALKRGFFGSTKRRNGSKTKQYRAPEVDNHNFSYDERHSIWSLGVTMYEMLYLQLPELPETINQKERLEITFPKRRQGKKDVTPEMKLFLTNCIQPLPYRIGFKELYETIAQNLQPWEDL